MVLAYGLRLQPGADLKQGIIAAAQHWQLDAGYILTTVGSLTQANLRFASQVEPTLLTGPFEIVSLVGTVAQSGLHLHLAIADATGQVVGGHVMAGCLIYTTAEVVIGNLPNLRFQREVDPTTGYRELVITEQP